MTKEQFQRIYDYLQNDCFAYVIVKKLKKFTMNEKRELLVQEVEKLNVRKDYLKVNININQKTFAFQNAVQTRKSNAYLIKRSVLEAVCNNAGLNIERLLLGGDVLVKEIKDVQAQEKRKNVAESNKRFKRKVREIEGASFNTSKQLVNWTSSNRKKLKKEATVCEKIVFDKLQQSLKGRVKKQQPFIIEGRLYYADMYIPSKKLIIEVDGGYHNTDEQKIRDSQRDKDFTSIGYTTMRIRNEDVMDRKKLSAFVNRIIASDIIIRDLK